MSPRPSFVLASASPARLQLLRSAGLRPDVVVSGVDESIVESTSAAMLCGTLARLKAEAVALRIQRNAPDTASVGRDAIVLGCDSVLEFGGEIHGKPVNVDEARERWARMRGRTGVLHTGHCLISVADGNKAEAATRTTVHFSDITDEELNAYLATDEPLQVAGAFTIDGFAGWFVDRIDGDHGTVIGVSLPTLRRLMAQLGITVVDLWPAPLPSGA